MVALAKRNLKAGEMLDGEGGYTVVGKLMPAANSLSLGGLPLGLAHQVALRNAVPHGQVLRWADVNVDETLLAVKARREMEIRFGADLRAVA